MKSFQWDANRGIGRWLKISLTLMLAVRAAPVSASDSNRSMFFMLHGTHADTVMEHMALR